MCNNKTDRFLLEEYKTSWQQIFNIDKRRITYIKYYSVIFFATAGFITHVVYEGYLEIADSVAITIPLIIAIFVGVAICYVLWCERWAKVRYMKKINLIRETFLTNLGQSDKQAAIDEYLTHKELGIKILTDEEKPPKGIEKTLIGIFTILALEIIALVIFIILIWLVAGLYY